MFFKNCFAYLWISEKNFDKCLCAFFCECVNSVINLDAKWRVPEEEKRSQSWWKLLTSLPRNPPGAAVTSALWVPKGSTSLLTQVTWASTPAAVAATVSPGPSYPVPFWPRVTPKPAAAVSSICHRHWTRSGGAPPGTFSGERAPLRIRTRTSSPTHIPTCSTSKPWKDGGPRQATSSSSRDATPGNFPPTRSTSTPSTWSHGTPARPLLSKKRFVPKKNCNKLKAKKINTNKCHLPALKLWLKTRNGSYLSR